MHCKQLVSITSLVTTAIVVILLTSTKSGRASDLPWGNHSIDTPLTATLWNGRVVRGRLDARTTPSQLWLTMEQDGVTISGMVNVNEIAKVERIDSKQLVVSDFGIDSTQRPQPTFAGFPSTNLEPDRKEIANKPAKSLAIYAHLDNWNGDPKPDGLRLFVAPRGPRGELVPEVGLLSVELHVYRGDLQSTRGGFHEVETWSAEISKSDYDPRGAMISLPFRNLQPENEREMHSFGVLKVRFKVAGRGVLDATLDEVPLRNHTSTEFLRNRKAWVR